MLVDGLVFNDFCLQISVELLNRFGIVLKNGQVFAWVHDGVDRELERGCVEQDLQSGRQVPVVAIVEVHAVLHLLLILLVDVRLEEVDLLHQEVGASLPPLQLPLKLRVRLLEEVIPRVQLCNLLEVLIHLQLHNLEPIEFYTIINILLNPLVNFRELSLNHRGEVNEVDIGLFGDFVALVVLFDTVLEHVEGKVDLLKDLFSLNIQLFQLFRVGPQLDLNLILVRLVFIA